MNQKDDSHKSPDEEVEAALLDVELFIKYQAPQRAVQRLKAAVERAPRSLALRERLRELAAAGRQPEEAARQCLALANLYLARDEYETAQERLLEAKQYDPRISIASGLEAVRRARRPELSAAHAPPPADAPASAPRRVTLAGDLSVVSIFDAVQVVENAKLTGALNIGDEEGRRPTCRLLFNEGRIVGAEAAQQTGLEAFRAVLEINAGLFDFEKSAHEFPVTIQALSNTNLLLDTLRQMDEEKM